MAELSDTDKLTCVIELIEDVVYYFDLWNKAKSETLKADYLVEFTNKLHDLKTWHPGYDLDTGTMPWERDDDVDYSC